MLYEPQQKTKQNTEPLYVKYPGNKIDFHTRPSEGLFKDKKVLSGALALLSLSLYVLVQVTKYKRSPRRSFSQQTKAEAD